MSSAQAIGGAGAIPAGEDGNWYRFCTNLANLAIVHQSIPPFAGRDLNDVDLEVSNDLLSGIARPRGRRLPVDPPKPDVGGISVNNVAHCRTCSYPNVPNVAAKPWYLDTTSVMPGPAADIFAALAAKKSCKQA